MKTLLVIPPVLFLLLLLGVPAGAQTQQEKLKLMRSDIRETVDGKEYFIHTIRKGQTLYMISKAYGVEVNEIIRENPQVKDGIRADETLRIPVPGPSVPVKKKGGSTTEKQVDPAKKEGGSEAVKPADSVPAPLLPCGVDTTTRKPLYHVALMLPLSLGAADKLDTANPDPKVLRNLKSFQFLPYYEGFLEALDSLKKTGLRVKLHVYDADRDTSRTRQLLKKPEMKEMDLIFGLLYHQNFQIAAAWAKKNRVNLVNPISERAGLVEGNPFVYQVQPLRSSQVPQIAEYLATAGAGAKVVIIRSGQYRDRDAPEKLKKACEEKSLDVELADGQEAAIARYSKDRTNYIVVFSDNQAYVLDLQRSLYKLRNDYAIRLVGLPEWSSINGMETEYLVAMGTHMMDRSFVDYTNPAVQQFVDRYQRHYHTDPPLLAFQGYDQALFFLSALKDFGTGFGRCLGEYNRAGLAGTYRFSAVGDGGYENTRWRTYRYDNYRLVPVD